MAAPKGNKNASGNHTPKPSKYTPEYLTQLASKMLDWFSQEENWWLKDFAIQQKMPWADYCELAKRSVEFSQALKICKDMQESKLLKKGYEPYCAPMSIFALKNVAGWRDKQEVEHSGSIQSVTVDVVDNLKEKVHAN